MFPEHSYVNFLQSQYSSKKYNKFQSLSPIIFTGIGHMANSPTIKLVFSFSHCALVTLASGQEGPRGPAASPPPQNWGPCHSVSKPLSDPICVLQWAQHRQDTEMDKAQREQVFLQDPQATPGDRGRWVGSKRGYGMSWGGHTLGSRSFLIPKPSRSWASLAQICDHTCEQWDLQGQGKGPVGSGALMGLGSNSEYDSWEPLAPPNKNWFTDQKYSVCG